MRKNKGIIQLVAIIITGLLCYSSIYVYAADTIPQGYTGIYDAQDLAAVNDNLDGKYILMNDIDLSTYGDWTPIGKSTGFSGVFDGNGYYIKNMQIGDETVYEDAGLFSTLQGATVKNLRVSGTINCDETPTLNVGAIAGQAYDSIIYRCGSYVNITYKDGESDGSSYTTAWERLCAGGIVGATWGNTKIEECFNANKVTGTATSTPLNIGGIVGWFSENTTINNCFNMADVSGNTGYVEIALGGIVGGQFSATKCLIQNSYNVGQVTGSHGKWKFDRSHIGGILGDCGNDDRTVISNCYYYSAAHTAVGVVRRLKSEGYDVDIIVDAKACEYTEMQKKSTYAGFDFTNVWKAGTSTSPFPILRWTSGNSSCSHTYTSAGGNICTSCGYEFKPELVEYNKTMYSTINNVAVRNQPYAKGGTLVKKLAKGEAVKVTHYFYNALGSKWYITSDGNYIFGDYLTLTGVKKHTLTFNANGSGVTNLPETAHIQEGVRMAIPGKASGIPERAGYTFIGYSTNKNASTAEYVPGRSIKLTEDTTLYAIWESNSDYTSYRNKINALKKAIGTKDICENQITKITKSDSKYIKSTGNCNVASVVTLLNRNLFYEGRTNEKQFTILNAYSANGCKVLYGPTLDYLRNGKQNSTNQYGYSYSGNTGAWACSRKYTNNSGTTYTVCNQSLSVINKNKGTQTYEEYIASLLNEHPEGICIRKKKGSSGHVCVVTDYEIVNGKYQFYVQDPVDKFTGKYEGSYQYREYGDITSNIDFIAFIK